MMKNLREKGFQIWARPHTSLDEGVESVGGNDKFDRLSKMGFEGGRSNYSIKALTTLTEWMQNPEWEDVPGQEPRIDEDSAEYEPAIQNMVSGRSCFHD